MNAPWQGNPRATCVRVLVEAIWSADMGNPPQSPSEADGDGRDSWPDPDDYGGDPYNYDDPYDGMPPDESTAWKRYLEPSGFPYDNPQSPFEALELDHENRFELLHDRKSTIRVAHEIFVEFFAEAWRTYTMLGDLENLDYDPLYRMPVEARDFAITLLSLQQLIRALEELYDSELLLAYRFSRKSNGWSELANYMNWFTDLAGLGSAAKVSRQGLRSRVERRIRRNGSTDLRVVEDLLRSVREIRSAAVRTYGNKPFRGPGRPRKSGGQHL